MSESFVYKGHTFTPYKRLHGGASHFKYMSKHISTWKTLIDPLFWNYNEFYSASGDANCDLFECDGELWIPARNYLFLWIGPR